MAETLLEQLHKKRDDLMQQKAKIQEKSLPLRAARDKIINEAAEKANVLEGQYIEMEKPLYQIDMDLGACARALGGRRMSQPEQA